jgi:hypothetical protein
MNNITDYTQDLFANRIGGMTFGLKPGDITLMPTPNYPMLATFMKYYGGDLEITWDENNHIWKKGTAEYICHVEIEVAGI